MIKSTESRNVIRLKTTAIRSLAAIRKGRESADAALWVIGKRFELGFDAVRNPANTDHGEFCLMLPEKVNALTATGLIFGEKSAMFYYELMRHMTRELTLAVRHSRAMFAMPDPVSVLTAQTAYVADAAQRMFTASLHLSSLSATMIDASGTPLHRTVMANAKRLS